MKAQIITALALAVLVALPTQAITPASAQTEIAKKAIAKAEAVVEKIKAACAKDLKSYCSTVTRGEGRIALCLMAHEDKISDGCFGAVFDAADDIELAMNKILRAAEVCDSDIEKVCGKVEPGEGRIAQCLVKNKAKLTSACQAEVTAIAKRLNK